MLRHEFDFLALIYSIHIYALGDFRTQKKNSEHDIVKYELKKIVYASMLKL